MGRDDVTVLALNEAMQDVPTTGPQASSLRRTLKDLAKKDSSVDPEDPQQFKLCGALKKLGVTKIDKRTFQEWADKISQFVKEERLVWLVQKEAFPELGENKKVAWWLLGPDEVQGVDHDKFWVLDYHVPTGPYMKGAIRRTIGWKADKEVGSKKPRLQDDDARRSGQSGGAAAAAEEPRQAAATPRPAAGDASGALPRPAAGEAGGAPEQKRRKTLTEHVSSEDNDDDSIRTLRSDCQQACQAGRFYIPGETDTAHFRAKMYVAYLKKQKEAFLKRTPNESWANTLSIESRYFFQYLADWVLKGDTFEVIGHFAPLFREAKELHPALVPKVALAVCSIGSVNLLGDFSGSEGELEKFGLPPKQIAALVGSPFLAGFRKARFDAQFALAKKASSWAARAAPAGACKDDSAGKEARPAQAAEQPDGTPKEEPAEKPADASAALAAETLGGEPRQQQLGGGPKQELPDGERREELAQADTPSGVPRQGQPGGEPAQEHPGGEPKQEQLGGERGEATPGGKAKGGGESEGSQADSAARLELILSLLGSPQAGEDHKKELEFAKAMMTTPPGPRMTHLLKMSIEEFAMLGAWFPGDPAEDCAILLKGVKYKDVGISSVVSAVQHVVKCGAQEALSNPIIRGLGGLYVRLNELQAKAPQGSVQPGRGPTEEAVATDVPQGQQAKFMASIFAEVASLRLGTVGFTSKERDYSMIPVKMLQEVHAMVSSAVPLVTPSMPAHALMWCHRRAVAEQEANQKKAQEEVAKGAEEPPKQGATEAAKPAGAPATGGAQAEVQAAGAAGQASLPKSRPAAPEAIAEGDIVVIQKSTKEPLLWVNKKARVLKLLTSTGQAQLQMLEGGKKDAKTTRQIENLKKVTAPPPEAGGGGAPGAAEAEAAKPVADAADAAKEIFGADLPFGEGGS